ncbi:tape measure protein [Cytobacillus sp.]|uniref:tape measure protein n=1 Tax=Cytobacillus sp. TaxID=2675269 RepID=UPI0028BEAEDC|nr:tape measure protein [Cytobacillus sp.]
MATIRTTVQIQDNMSRAFQSMNNAMNIVINSFEQLQRQSSNAVNTNSIQTARQELARAESAFNEIEEDIRRANQQQQNLNNNINRGTSAANGLLSKLAAVVTTYLSLQAGKSIIDLSDQLTNITARLNMVNDGLQTTAELQQMIYDSAQRSYGSYADTADLVGKLSMNAKDAFSSNSEAIAFAELLNKQFSIAGTSADGMKNATIQLTQALGGGVLRGQELNSIFEHAPNIIHTIAEYLDVPIGKIREMAAEGMLSADVVKKAMFAATDEINEKFDSMPLTFEQIWTSFKNKALWAFQPILQKLNEIANNEKFQGTVNSIVNSLYILSDIALSTMSVLMTIGGFVYENWSLISPVIWGIVGALGVYTGAIIANSIVQGINTLIQTAQAIAIAVKTRATIADAAATNQLTVAQWALNSAMLANPITWVVALVIALISVFYLAIAVINKFAGTSISATGIIAGVFFALGAFIFNIVAFLWNIFASIAEFFVNVWNHPMYSVKKLFVNLVTSVLDMIISMTKGWDGFATSFVNAMISAVNGVIKAWNWLVDLLPESVTSALGIGKGTEFSHRTSITSDLESLKTGLNSWVSDAPDGYWEAPKLEMKNIGAAFSSGYDKGAAFSDNVKDAFNMDELMNNAQALDQIAGALDQVNSAGEDTAGNTKKMADSMKASEEDLKYLRDIAERDAINRFTTAEVKVDLTNHNNVNSELDLDGIIDRFGEKLVETLDSVAEGV